MHPILDLWVPALLWLMMLVVGLGLSRDDFRRLRGRSASVAAATLAQIVLLPLVAVGLILAFDPATPTAIGLILLSVCPGGAISNYYAHVVKGNVALSGVLTAITSLTCLVTTPISAQVICSLLFAETTRFEVPTTRILLQLGFFVLLPIALGMGFRSLRPALALRWLPGLNRISIVALIGLLIAVLVDQRQAFSDDVDNVIALAIAFTLAGFGIGTVTGLAVRASLDETVSLALEFSVRNLAVMALIAVSILDNLEYLFFGAIFFIVQMPTALTAVGILKRLHSLRASVPAG